MVQNSNSQAPAINEHLIAKAIIARNNQAVISSRKIALIFEKNHDDVLRDIRNTIRQLEEGWALISLRNFAESDFGLLLPEIRKNSFIETSYKSDRGKEYPEFILNRSAFDHLVTGYTGIKATVYKALLLARYESMEKKLTERSNTAYQQAIDFVRVVGENADFKTLISAIPKIVDEFGRNCPHYLFSLEKFGFSTSSGSVRRRVRRNPKFFVHHNNSTYIVENFLYNMFLGKIKSNNDKAFKSMQLELTFNTEGGVR